MSCYSWLITLNFKVNQDAHIRISFNFIFFKNVGWKRIRINRINHSYHLHVIIYISRFQSSAFKMTGYKAGQCNYISIPYGVFILNPSLKVVQPRLKRQLRIPALYLFLSGILWIFFYNYECTFGFRSPFPFRYYFLNKQHWGLYLIKPQCYDKRVHFSRISAAPYYPKNP